MAAKPVLRLLESRHDPAFLRLVALAWLVKRGLRSTACCDSRGVWDAAAAIGGDVQFFVRSAAKRATDMYDLGDGVVMCRAGAWAPLEPAWAEHRRAYNRQYDLGVALGYLTPQTERGQGEAQLVHQGTYAGVSAKIWNEWLLPGAGEEPLNAYTERIREALAEIGIEYSSSRA